ncbi:unnamed protein product, partial [Allacma fusca]
NIYFCVHRNPQVKGRCVILPEFGTGFRIISVSKSGRRTVVPLALSRDTRCFYALFDEDDVDFEIKYDNTTCADRDVEITLDLHNKRKSFRLPNSSEWKQDTFERNGGKFHFVRQSGQGLLNVGLLAAEQSLTFEGASALISRIGFCVRYSTPGYRIFVQDLFNVEKLPLVVHNTDTVELIKSRLEYEHNIPMSEQTLMFMGKSLEDGRTVGDYDIQEDSILFSVIRSIGGGGGLDTNHPQDSTTGDVRPSGAIVFGECIVGNERPLQTLQNHSEFPFDYSVQAEDFTIELQLAPCYKNM